MKLDLARIAKDFQVPMYPMPMGQFHRNWFVAVDASGDVIIEVYEDAAKVATVDAEQYDLRKRNDRRK